MSVNRWTLENTRVGMAQELQAANKTLSEMYADPVTKMEDREAQKKKVEDLKERLEGINEQIKAYDDEATKKLQPAVKSADPKETRVKAKAALYRSVMRNEPIPQEHYKALTDGGASGGEKFLPKTVSTEIIAEPIVKNPLREISTITNITNLELPRIAFTLSDDDDFIADGASAKELALTGSTVTFGRYKFKVFADISETVLLGTDTDLVNVVERGLESGLAKKEKKVAFRENPTVETEKHMSFYNQSTAGTYDIMAIEGVNLYETITQALADLEDDYRDNSKIVMRYSDYLSIIKTLSNGNATLYGVPPEQVLGKPTVFCDMAKIPVVGDFSYSHFNYDIAMQYERDKNIKTGMESFVLTAWFDHQIKMRSAFRLAVVKASQP